MQRAELDSLDGEDHEGDLPRKHERVVPDPHNPPPFVRLEESWRLGEITSKAYVLSRRMSSGSVVAAAAESLDVETGLLGLSNHLPLRTSWLIWPGIEALPNTPSIVERAAWRHVFVAEWDLAQAKMTLRFSLARIRRVEDSDEVVTDDRHVAK